MTESYTDAMAATWGRRIEAAIEIHQPCHTAPAVPWACVMGHSDTDCTTGLPGPDQPAVCIECTYDDRVITYPCPTAIALGIKPSGESTP